MHIIGLCFIQNDVKRAKTRYFALNTRFMHILGFNAMKALRNMQTHYNKMRITSAEISNFLRLNACCSKSDVKCAKTRYSALKTRSMHIIGFNAMKALGNVLRH